MKDQLFLQIMQNCPHNLPNDKLEEYVKKASEKADFIFDLYKGLKKSKADNPSTKENED